MFSKILRKFKKRKSKYSPEIQAMKIEKAEEKRARRAARRIKEGR